MEEPLDLQDVTAFLAVVDTGSFTSAARRLGLAKSNVSRRVARLEQQLGARLLERTTRRQRLTEVGEIYHEHVSAAMKQLAQASHSVSEIQGEPRGRLRITAPADWNETMGRLVAEFSARWPYIQLDIDLTQRRVDLVAEGFDLALRAGRLEDSSLIARAVGEGATHLYASPAYLERRGTPRSVAELAEHAFVLFRGRHGEARLELDGSDGHREEITVSGVISALDFSFVRHALLHGAGIGMLPDSIGAAELDAGGLRLVLPSYCLGRSPFHVVYPSARFLSPKVRVFVDFCVEWVGAELRRSADVVGQHAAAAADDGGVARKGKGKARAIGRGR
ncbi:LysR family transcriptional regulator [Paraliomyxa miuraensis]|uniref:LysR family transcriptional regulator n=1 Tax=Paraliomyxa miuraensis TaxID=376150 RepID=UPI00225A36B6|nr:LysR family transcriptional regulator [Paraliomyxa miuraensis]MCX4247436.1 LysR family transcriptional regulator [Paraliomyxa miuraensis]